MRTEDFTKFQQLMTTLSELYDKSPSEAALKMYALALKNFTIEEITRGVERAISELKFFPKPAELIELIQGTAADRAEQAWEVLWNAYLKAGFWHSVLFQDGAIARSIRIVFGGWVQMSQDLKASSPEMIQAKRKQFAATYRREALQPREPERLPGYHEIQNLNTVNQWTRDQFSDTYRQRIFIAQAEGSRFVEANFHRNSAQMIESDVQLLNAARLPQLPAKPRLELLPPPSEEARRMSPEEIQAGIRDLIQSVKAK